MPESGRGTRPVRVACVHLYDDFSGSAKVFAEAVAALRAAGADVRVIVGSAGKTGFIRRTHQVETVPYRYSERKLVHLVWFALAQIWIFARVVRLCLTRRTRVVYANTVLTPGASLAGRLCRRRVVVHLHEVGLGSQSLFPPLLRLCRLGADQLICVSAYVRSALELPRERTSVVYNALSADEWFTAQKIRRSRKPFPGDPFVVLMACSLKAYKGLDSFLAIAERCGGLPHPSGEAIRFRLLLNCGVADWERYSRGLRIPGNVSVHIRPDDVYLHYAAASLVVNLSHRDGWIETFGLTLLEAMSCGVPVIAPVVGGCTELVRDGHGGWQIDSRDLDALAERVLSLFRNPTAWLLASEEAVEVAGGFHPERFSSELRRCVLGELA